MKQKPNAKEQKGRRQSSQPNTDTAGEEVPSQPVEAQQLPETVDDVNAVNPVQQTSESIATGGEAIHEAAELPIEVRVEPINADTEIPVQEPIIVAQPEEPKSKKKYIKLDDVETVKFDLPAEPEQSTESRLADIVSDIKAEDAMKQLRASLANISRQESTVGDGRDSSARPEGVKGLSAEAEFLEYSAKQTKSLFNKLRDQTDQIEGSIAVGESEVLHRDEIAFLAARHELAVIKLKDSHTVDYQKRKDALAATLVARRDRKKTKREARKSIRASKKRDQIIQQQEKAAHAAARIRETISEKRVAFDGLTQHLYAIHDKQRKNLIHAQERKFANEKLMVDLETRHLKV